MEKQTEGPRRNAWVRSKARAAAAWSMARSTKGAKWGAWLLAGAAAATALGWGGQAVGVRVHQGFCQAGWAQDCAPRQLAWVGVEAMGDRRWAAALGEPGKRLDSPAVPAAVSKAIGAGMAPSAAASREQALIDKLRERRAQSVEAGAQGFALPWEDARELRRILERRERQAKSDWDALAPKTIDAIGRGPQALKDLDMGRLAEAANRLQAAREGLSAMRSASSVSDASATLPQAFAPGRAWLGENAKIPSLWAQQQERGRAEMAAGVLGCAALLAFLGGAGKGGLWARAAFSRKRAAKRAWEEGLRRWGKERQADAVDRH